MFEYFLIGAVIVSGLVNAHYFFSEIRKPKNNKPIFVKQRCTGYATSIGTLFDDCKSHQSSNCNDGRCSFHCKQNCKCEGLDVPQFNKFMKPGVN